MLVFGWAYGLTISFLAYGRESVCSGHVVFLGGKLIVIAVVWENVRGDYSIILAILCVGGCIRHGYIGHGVYPIVVCTGRHEVLIFPP